jgi:hypothetical protein
MRLIIPLSVLRYKRDLELGIASAAYANAGSQHQTHNRRKSKLQQQLKSQEAQGNLYNETTDQGEDIDPGKFLCPSCPGKNSPQVLSIIQMFGNTQSSQVSKATVYRREFPLDHAENPRSPNEKSSPRVESLTTKAPTKEARILALPILSKTSEPWASSERRVLRAAAREASSTSAMFALLISPLQYVCAHLARQTRAF